MSRGDSKYIAIDNGLSNFLVVFPHFIEHASIEVAGEVYGAGFIRVDPETRRYVCYGESVSLNLSCQNPMDTILANKQLPALG